MSVFKCTLLLITLTFCAIVKGLDYSCIQIWSRDPSVRHSNGIYKVSINGQERQVYCDMVNGGWTLVARFSNADDPNWITSGALWYDRTDELGAVTDPTVNADAMSAAFFGVTATELRITRSDSISHNPLLTTTNNCLQGQSVRDKIASFGNLRSQIWASDAVRGTCSAIFENEYQSTSGFKQVGASGCEIGDSNGISFFADWGNGDGAVIMIGGGGSCGTTGTYRADHGIGVTEANHAQFGLKDGITMGHVKDFGDDGNYGDTAYSLNMWVRNDDHVSSILQWIAGIAGDGKSCNTLCGEIGKTCDVDALKIQTESELSDICAQVHPSYTAVSEGNWNIRPMINLDMCYGYGNWGSNPADCDATNADPLVARICACAGDGLGWVDDTTCQWHQLNKMNKVINSENFFGFECPVNEVLSGLRLQGYASNSVLSNNPTAALCCQLGGYSAVTNICVDSFSSADGNLEAAVCEENSALVAVYDLVDPTLQQSQWQYQATNGITCCDIDYDTEYGRNLNLGIDRNQCEILSHSNPTGSFDLACPMDMVLVEIMDNDPAHGVQEVHQIECCRVINFEAPSQAPTQSPSTSLPTQAPTTACYDCLIGVHGKPSISDQETFVNEIENCLSLCCVA